MKPKADIILADDKLEEMAAMGLTDKEITNLTGLTQSEWRNGYKEVLERGRARLHQSLRKAQIQSALKGNATLLIWLGKQYLGQRDRIETQLNAEHRAISITPNVLERLQTSYKLTMEQVRARGALPTQAPTPAGEEGPGGTPGDRVGVLKTANLSNCAGSE